MQTAEDDDPAYSSSSSSETSSISSYSHLPNNSIPITCPSHASPGTLISRTGTSRSTKKNKHNNNKGTATTPTTISNKYVAIPKGIQPGEVFHIPIPLSTGQIKETLSKGTSMGYSTVELELTRSLVMQEVTGMFLQRRKPIPNTCKKRIQCLAATSCLHPLCFCFGCSSGESREFLFKDGHSDENEFLYLIKEKNDTESYCTVRQLCNPNHSFVLEAYRVLPKSKEGILKPDIRRGPEFTMERNGNCMLSGCACFRECKHKFIIRDRNDIAKGITSAGFQNVTIKNKSNNGGTGRIIGFGKQPFLGKHCCTDCTFEAMLCCTPTIQIMRRDIVMTGKGWGNSDRVLGLMEGPCCCYGGICCKHREKHWYFSKTSGKAYDVGALMMSDVSRHHVPIEMNYNLIGDPILMEFTKRGLSNIDKKLSVAAMLSLKYTFLRSWEQGVVFCNCHFCGANCQW